MALGSVAVTSSGGPRDDEGGGCSQRAKRIVGALAFLLSLMTWMMTGSPAILIFFALFWAVHWLGSRVLTSDRGNAVANGASSVGFVAVAAIALARVLSAGFSPVAVHNLCAETLGIPPLGLTVASGASRTIPVPRGVLSAERQVDRLVVRFGGTTVISESIKPESRIEVDGQGLAVGEARSIVTGDGATHTVVVCAPGQ